MLELSLVILLIGIIGILSFIYFYILGFRPTNKKGRDNYLIKEEIKIIEKKLEEIEKEETSSI